jgi:hypothetical protein
MWGLAGAGLCAVTLHARASGADGVLIVTRVTTGTDTTTSQVQMDKNRMRAEVSGASGANQIVVFDGTKQVMVIIDTQKKTYNEITKADMDKLGAQLSDAMAQMQAQMASLPPAQRAQVEQMMKGRMGGAGAPAAKTEYKKTGTDKVGRWTCDKYEGMQNGQKTKDICTVEPSALGLSATDFDVAKQMAEFFKKLLPAAGDQIISFGRPEEQGYSGVPVRSTSTVAGKQMTSEITEVTHQAFPDSVFAVPEGFKKVDFMGGRGRGGW